MTHRHYEIQLADGYDGCAARYRHDDEIESRTPAHRRIGSKLRRICDSFARPIRILEIGCGTGRYFHWLRNAQLLVGVDLSAEMLRHAQHPLRAEKVTAAEIRLLQGNVYEMDFERESFEFIYSLGVFGYGAEMTAELGGRLHDWLAPGGRLFFDAIERPSTTGLTFAGRCRHHARYHVLPWLPGFIKSRLARKARGIPVIRHTRGSIAAAISSAGFDEIAIASVPCRSPLWNGVHVECTARKPVSARGREIDRPDFARSQPAAPPDQEQKTPRERGEIGGP